MTKKLTITVKKFDQERQSFSLTTVIYPVVLLTLFSLLCITKTNHKDHLRMLIFVGISIIPAVTILGCLWYFLKPKKTGAFLFLSSVISIPLLLLGRVVMKKGVHLFVDKGVKWGPNFWTNHGGLAHYINNVITALLLTCYFSIPYFLSIWIARETRLSFKKTSIIGLWVFWISASYVLGITLFTSGLN